MKVLLKKKKAVIFLRTKILIYIYLVYLTVKSMAPETTSLSVPLKVEVAWPFHILAKPVLLQIALQKSYCIQTNHFNCLPCQIFWRTNKENNLVYIRTSSGNLTHALYLPYKIQVKIQLILWQAFMNLINSENFPYQALVL